jgi:hypothetical protein|tara:strand:+ start:57 stop:203 length:147 start_codon:yes stop_codon:yes gene_type:complete
LVSGKQIENGENAGLESLKSLAAVFDTYIRLISFLLLIILISLEKNGK